ncbi:hypothetical protein CsatA_006626 [Cannabis sativa]
MPDSLLSRLLKHRYFSNSTFLDANIGHSPSLTWQSISWGKELLVKGLRYKVGNGNHIDSKLDPWIPGFNEFKLVSYLGSNSLPVSSFITEELVWNVPMLNRFFQPIDSDRILTIPLSYFAEMDRLIWHYTSNGSYTVQSGFHLANSLEEQLCSSTSNNHSDWWKFFWNLVLPPKIRIFVWKVLHNILPTAAALFKKKVLTSAECSLCASSWESIGHALFGCKHAKVIWKTSKFRLDLSKAQNMFNGDYLHSLSTILNQQDFELLLCIMWGIWTDRNKVVHGGSPRQPAAIINYAVCFHEDFTRAKQVLPSAAVDSNQNSATSFPVTVQHAPKWQPPPHNGFKLNVDAATNVDQKKLGIRAIIRDHNGVVVATYSKVVQGNFRSDEMEAKALFHALNWALQKQLAITHIETDALRVSNALTFASKDLSCFSDLIMDVRCLLSFFPQVLVTHVKGSANQEAHGLAKFSLGLDDDICWIGEIPYPIFSVVVNDF